MSRIKQFFDSIAANLASAGIIAGGSTLGSILLGAFVAATHGLGRAEQATIIGLSSIVLMALVVVMYVGIRSKQLRKAESSLPSEPPDPLQLKIHKATWGNSESKNDVRDAIAKRARNALMFYVSQDAFPLPDPAWGDDNKHVEVTYSYSGIGQRPIRRKQGEWIVIPEDPHSRKKIEDLTKFASSSKSAIQNLKTAGECEQLAWQAEILKQKLLAITQQLTMEHNEEGLNQIEYPLYRGFPDPNEPDRWKWYHRSLQQFQYLYQVHRDRVHQLSLKDFRSVVIIHEVGSNFAGSDRVSLGNGLEEHRRALLVEAERLVQCYTDAVAFALST